MKTSLIVVLCLGFMAGAGLCDAGESSAITSPMAIVEERVRTMCLNFEKRMASPDHSPSIRELTACGLALMELGYDKERAERLVLHAFDNQIMDKKATNYGTVLWQEGRPEIQDANAIEFTMLPVGPLMIENWNRLSSSFKKEMLPHLRAGVVAIQRHQVKPSYSNIYLMRLCNLLLLGQLLEDSAVVDEAKAAFEVWLAFTRANGLSEYNSPTYSPIQAECLAIACHYARDAVLKKRMQSALDFFWVDLASNYFPGRQTMAGPASRDYNFLFSDSNVEYNYYLCGLRSVPPGQTFLSDVVRFWYAARHKCFVPSREMLALATRPERIIRSRFGMKPGQDRYLWITPSFTIGSSSSYYGPQDKTVCVELASEKPLPLITYVADAQDAPFGLFRSKDRSGHNKPHHLQTLQATVQEKGALLALFDLAPGCKRGAFTNLSSNVLLPLKADKLTLNGQLVPSNGPFSIKAGADSIVTVQESNTLVVIRLFGADGLKTQPASWALVYDGNKQKAARLTAWHYQGEPATFAKTSFCSGLFMMAAQFTTDPERAAFIKLASQAQIDKVRNDKQWSASVKAGETTLEAGLDLAAQSISYRRVNGQPWIADVLNVNGREFANDLP